MPIPVLPTGKNSFAIFSILILAHPFNPVELPCPSDNISEPVSDKLTKKAESYAPDTIIISPDANLTIHPQHRLLALNPLMLPIPNYGKMSSQTRNPQILDEISALFGPYHYESQLKKPLWRHRR